MAAIQDATLVAQALEMAIARRPPQAGLLHHSDRGSTYTSESYQALLQQEGIRASMSRTADCYDNAAMESFFHRFKGECIDGESFQTRAQGRLATFDDIESFYNRTRRHSTLNYMSPLSYEQVMCSIPSLGSPQKRVKISLEVKRGHSRPSLRRSSRNRLLGPSRQSLPMLALGTSVQNIASSPTISPASTTCRSCRSFSDPCHSSLMRGSFENR